MPIVGVSLAENAVTSERVAYVFQCDASAAVGDLVRFSTLTDGKVLILDDNLSVGPCVGVIAAKPQAQLAEVLLLGLKGGYADFARGAKVFVSETGEPTTDKPTAGYLQIIGVATSSSEFLFIPNSTRTKLV